MDATVPLARIKIQTVVFSYDTRSVVDFEIDFPRLLEIIISLIEAIFDVIHAFGVAAWSSAVLVYRMFDLMAGAILEMLFLVGLRGVLDSFALWVLEM